MSDEFGQFWRDVDALKSKHDDIMSELKVASEKLEVKAQVSADGDGYHVRFTKRGVRKHLVAFRPEVLLKQIADEVEAGKPRSPDAR